MDNPKEKPEPPEAQIEGSEGSLPFCTCGQDPFASLPPEIRPRSSPKKDGLRKVTCPGCGLVYYTNRKADLCVGCEKKGVRFSDSTLY